MLRSLVVKVSIAAAAVASLATVPAARAESVEGVITRVELRESPRHIMVRTGSGEVQVRVANRTSVDFGAVDQGYFSPELSSLKPGMQVQTATNGDEPATRIHVTSVPSDQRSAAIREFERTRPSSSAAAADAAANGEYKVRLTDVNRNRGTFKADVAGREKSFRAEDPKLLARFEEGDLVIVRVRDDNVVTDVRSSALYGRIVDIDHTAGVVQIEADGRTQSYKVGRVKGLTFNVGDRVRFQMEERATGEKVIVKMDRD
jgi:hypothetical protein